MLKRLLALLVLATGLSACASSALPNGAPPVSSLYSFENTARFMLGDVCIPSAMQGVSVASRTDVPAVYPVTGSSNAWRAGPGGAVRVIDEGGGACTVTLNRGIQMDVRDGLIREIDQSRAGFARLSSDAQRGAITDTYCARGQASYPPGLSVLLRTEVDTPPGDAVRLSASVRPRPDLCR